MLTQSIYLFLSALVLAFVEVQIEGKAGWASGLPTWTAPDRWYSRLYGKIMAGKTLTGYHLGIFLFVLLFLHYPLVSADSLNWRSELEILSTFFVFVVFWDYLWIIINPYYGVWRRRPRLNVWWHKHWWGPWPRDYYFGILISWLLIIPLWRQDEAAIWEWLFNLSVFAVGTLVVLLITEATRGDVKNGN